MVGRLKQCSKAMFAGDQEKAIQFFLDHLLQKLSQDGRLPLGFQGTQVIELFKLLYEARDKTPPTSTDLSEWIKEFSSEE